MTSKEAKERYGIKGDYLTVGKLKEILYNYPNDALVVAQRVEDRYYEGVDISGMSGRLSDGTFGTLPPGSKATGWQTLKKPDHLYPEEENNEYSPVWSVVHYKDDTDCLFLDLHY
jgi:hypothetical protein